MSGSDSPLSPTVLRERADRLALMAFDMDTSEDHLALRVAAFHTRLLADLLDAIQYDPRGVTVGEACRRSARIDAVLEAHRD